MPIEMLHAIQWMDLYKMRDFLNLVLEHRDQTSPMKDLPEGIKEILRP